MLCPHCNTELRNMPTKCPYCTGDITYGTNNSIWEIVKSGAIIGAIGLPIIMYLINANRNIEDYIGGIFVGAILGPIALFFMGASQPQKK
jgi:hypothetical protein